MFASQFPIAMDCLFALKLHLCSQEVDQPVVVRALFQRQPVPVASAKALFLSLVPAPLSTHVLNCMFVVIDILSQDSAYYNEWAKIEGVKQIIAMFARERDDTGKLPL